MRFVFLHFSYNFDSFVCFVEGCSCDLMLRGVSLIPFNLLFYIFEKTGYYVNMFSEHHFFCSLQDINEEWISDKTRFCYDGLKRQRLNDPMIRGPDGRFKAVTWRDALAVVAEVLHQVKPEEITGVAGKLSDAESMMALKDFVNRMGSDKVLCEGNGPNPPADMRSNYLMNTSIAGLEKADVFLLVGTQVKFSSVLSAIFLIATCIL